MEPTNTPPPVTAGTDGTSDTELLKAISANPECAHILAEIASGGNAKELIATLLSPDDTPEEESTGQDSPAEADDSDIAMFRSPGREKKETSADGCPAFLSTTRPDFWDMN